MTDEDFKKIRQLIKEETRSVKEIMEVAKYKIDSQELYLKGLASSVRAIKEQQSVMNQKMDGIAEQIEASEKRIIREVGDFVEDQIIPQIEDKADQETANRIERKLDLMTDKVLKHDRSIADIQSLPTIAHELRLKKAA